MSAAHLRACVLLIDRTMAAIPPGRTLIPVGEVHDALLDLRNAVQGAYVIESLGLDRPPSRLPRRLRRDGL